MKKRILIILALMVLSLSGCSKGKIIDKTAPELIKMFDDGQSFVMYAGTSNCGTCDEFRDILGQVLNDYDLTVYYLLADDYEDEDVKNLIYNYLYKLQWTPTMYIVENGRVVNLNENENNSLMHVGSLKIWLMDNGAISD